MQPASDAGSASARSPRSGDGWLEKCLAATANLAPLKYSHPTAEQIDILIDTLGDLAERFNLGRGRMSKRHLATA